mmetsp:Transcript_18459/g.22678  ORF Transcript_18459/g.22678 Transcript_18459/m.22678 type:complete len:349 (+) Transcript_18459:791-1837(+)
MEWVKARGFRYIYIWACPPQRGDAYIIYCHPKWQRTPSAERLRKWYGEMIEQCKAAGVIIHQTNIYEKHLSSFRPLVNTRATHKSSSTRMSATSSLAPTSSKFSSLTTDNKSSMKINYPVENLPYFYGDYIPNEIESLLARLSRKTFQSDRSIVSWWETIWGVTAKATLATLPVNNNDTSEYMKGEAQMSVMNKTGPSFWKFESTVDLNSIDFHDPPGSSLCTAMTPNQRNEWLMRKLATSIKPMSENFFVLQLSGVKNKSKEKGTKKKKRRIVNDYKNHGFGADVSLLKNTILKSDTSDPDPVLPPGIFDTRLAFLDYSQQRHLQFDQLRRAKYSSIVLLQHLTLDL